MTRLPRAGAVILAALAALTGACGAALHPLPVGPGAPAPDGAEALAQAVSACRRVTSLSAEMSVSGSAGGQRLRGRVLVGLAAPASALLDAAAPFGASLFIYAARDSTVTLLLPRDQRVLRHDDPAAVLEAVTGVPLGAADLRQALTGCVGASDAVAARAFGDGWRVASIPGGEAYLRRVAGTWRLVTALRRDAPEGGWRADYDQFEASLPRIIRLLSADDGGRRFDVRLRLSQVEINPALGPEVFDVPVPPALSPITLGELRANGPMAERDR